MIVVGRKCIGREYPSASLQRKQDFAARNRYAAFNEYEMKQVSDTQLLGEIDHLFKAGEYRKALDLSTEGLNLFPERAPFLNYWRICLASRLGKSELACQVMDDVLESGIWYSERILRESPSLQPLQGNPHFERLAALSREQRTPTEGDSLITFLPDSECGVSDSPCPLLIAHMEITTMQ
jgi:hypothetical protein